MCAEEPYRERRTLDYFECNVGMLGMKDTKCPCYEPGEGDDALCYWFGPYIGDCLYRPPSQVKIPPRPPEDVWWDMHGGLILKGMHDVNGPIPEQDYRAIEDYCTAKIRNYEIAAAIEEITQTKIVGDQDE